MDNFTHMNLKIVKKFAWNKLQNIFKTNIYTVILKAFVHSKIMWTLLGENQPSWHQTKRAEIRDNLNLVTRKPVLGVSDQVRLKPACSASETS